MLHCDCDCDTPRNLNGDSVTSVDSSISTLPLFTFSCASSIPWRFSTISHAFISLLPHCIANPYLVDRESVRLARTCRGALIDLRSTYRIKQTITQTYVVQRVLVRPNINDSTSSVASSSPTLSHSVVEVPPSASVTPSTSTPVPPFYIRRWFSPELCSRIQDTGGKWYRGRWNGVKNVPLDPIHLRHINADWAQSWHRQQIQLDHPWKPHGTVNGVTESSPMLSTVTTAFGSGLLSTTNDNLRIGSVERVAMCLLDSCLDQRYQIGGRYRIRNYWEPIKNEGAPTMRPTYYARDASDASSFSSSLLSLPSSLTQLRIDEYEQADDARVPLAHQYQLYVAAEEMDYADLDAAASSSSSSSHSSASTRPMFSSGFLAHHYLPRLTDLSFVHPMTRRLRIDHLPYAQLRILCLQLCGMETLDGDGPFRRHRSVSKELSNEYRISMMTRCSESIGASKELVALFPVLDLRPMSQLTKLSLVNVDKFDFCGHLLLPAQLLHLNVQGFSHDQRCHRETKENVQQNRAYWTLSSSSGLRHPSPSPYAPLRIEYLDDFGLSSFPLLSHLTTLHLLFKCKTRCDSLVHRLPSSLRDLKLGEGVITEWVALAAQCGALEILYCGVLPTIKLFNKEDEGESEDTLITTAMSEMASQSTSSALSGYAALSDAVRQGCYICLKHLFIDNSSCPALTDDVVLPCNLVSISYIGGRDSAVPISVSRLRHLISVQVKLEYPRSKRESPWDVPLSSLPLSVTRLVIDSDRTPRFRFIGTQQQQQQQRQLVQSAASIVPSASSLSQHTSTAASSYSSMNAALSDCQRHAEASSVRLSSLCIYSWSWGGGYKVGMWVPEFAFECLPSTLTSLCIESTTVTESVEQKEQQFMEQVQRRLHQLQRTQEEEDVANAQPLKRQRAGSDDSVRECSFQPVSLETVPVVPLRLPPLHNLLTLCLPRYDGPLDAFPIALHLPSLTELVTGSSYPIPQPLPPKLKTLILAGVRRKYHLNEPWDQPLPSYSPCSAEEYCRHHAQLDVAASAAYSLAESSSPISSAAQSDVKWNPRREYVPNSVTKLGLFDQPINHVLWPQTLTAIDLGDKFNQPVHDVAWPMNLQRLWFGISFNQPLTVMQHNTTSDVDVKENHVHSEELPPALAMHMLGNEHSLGSSSTSAPSSPASSSSRHCWPASLTQLVLPVGYGSKARHAASLEEARQMMPANVSIYA